MALANAHLAALPDREREELESWLVGFDASWKEGQLAAWVEKLPPPGSPKRTPALVEMVKIDLERQWTAGRQIALDEYLDGYPELGTAETVPADLVQAEYEVRNELAGPVGLDEYESRFPRQARELVELIERAKQILGQTETYRPGDTDPGDRNPASAARPTTPPDELPSTFGRYRIVKRLGQGGMGSVYLAHDTQLDRQVALKVPRFSPDDSPAVLERFEREARAAATIQHPNLCPVYDVGDVGGVHYLTMAYVEGKPLSHYTASPKPLDQRQVAAVVRKLALALKEAHRKGVVHRDLKPANVMINERREPVILDFGLARREGYGDATITQSGAIVGTPAYMSPEQVRGEHDSIGPASDVYSLGVILYELLTGERPFNGPVAAVLGQIQYGKRPAVSEMREDVAPELETICHRAMAREIGQRYQSMAELAEALGQFLRPPRKPGKSAGAAPAEPTGSSAPSPPSEPGTQTLAAEFFANLATHEPSAVPSRLRSYRGKGKPRKQRPAWHWIVAIGAGSLAAILLLGVVLTISTPHGTVKIEFDDPKAADVCVVYVDEEIRIENLDKPLSLALGAHELTVKHGDVEVEPPRKFTIRRGSNPAIRIEYKPRSAGTRTASRSSANEDDDPAAKADEAGPGESVALADTPITTGLIGYWPFDGTGNDLSGGDRHVALQGGAQYAPGLFGQALSLLGKADQGAARPIDDPIYDFGANDFTVQAWVHMNSLDDSVGAVFVEKFSDRDGPGWTFCSPIFRPGACQLYARPSADLVSAAKTLTTGAWHHIVARRRRSEFDLFRDGNIVARGLDPDPVADTPSPLLIGRRNDADKRGSSLDGRIDEVGVWARALDDREIAYLYNSGDGRPIVAEPASAQNRAGTWLETASEPMNLRELNTSSDDLAVTQGDDPCELIFVSDRPEGKGRGDLYVSRRASVDGAWGKPINITELNTPHSESVPALRLDRLEIFFTSQRPGGKGGPDLWRSSRSRVDARWSDPELVSELCSTQIDACPHLTRDGLAIYFSSSRPAPPGGGIDDIYVARRKDLTSPFGKPEFIAELSSPASEAAPCLSSDELAIYFTSNRKGSEGEHDIWYATRPTPDSRWSTPVQCPGINGPRREFCPFESPDGRTFYFESIRPGGKGGKDIWVVERKP